MASNADYIYQLRFWIKNISPCIWRRVLVKDNCSIADLHYIIQFALNWCDTYLNQFSIRGKSYGVAHDGGAMFCDDPREVYLKDFQFYHNERFLYQYNFFDNWEVEVRVENNNIVGTKKYYPFCIDGKRTAREEDCGGPFRYMELVEYYSRWRIEEKLLKAIRKYQSNSDKGEFTQALERLRCGRNSSRIDP